MKNKEQIKQALLSKIYEHATALYYLQFTLAEVLEKEIDLLVIEYNKAFTNED